MPSRDAIYRFGPYELRSRSHEVYKDGVKLKVRPQVFQILHILAERSGDVVTREELRHLLWPEVTFVDFEHGLNAAVKELRGLLNDSASEPRYVETLPKLGYRFLIPVAVAVPESKTPAESSPSISHLLAQTPREFAEPVSLRFARRKNWRLALFIGAFALSGGLLAKYLSHPRKALALKGTDTIVLADFQNTTGEQVFDDALRQGLAVGLEQSPYLHVLSDRKASVTLRQMGRAPDERLAGQVALEVCQRSGSKVIVQGSISTLGRIYLIGVTALRCDTGDAVAHEQTEAKQKEEIIGALGTASTRLREHLGESVLSIKKYNAPLEQVTTNSLEALKAYGSAYWALGRGEDRLAISLFQRAVELDPNFAMAYGQLSSAYRNLGETELSRQNAVKAFQLKERLTESERLEIESWYNVFVTGDLERATQIYELELQNYPPKPDVLNDLGATYVSLGRYEKALDLFRQVQQLEPSASEIYMNLVPSLLATEQIAQARAVLSDAARDAPLTEFLLEDRFWTAFREGNTKEMEEILSEAPKVPGARPLLLTEQSRTEAYFGRMEKSRQLAESAARLLEQNGEKESAASCLVEAAVREAEVGEASQARRHALSSLRLSRSQQVMTLAALAIAKTGDTNEAEKLVDELSKNNPLDTLIQKYWIPTIRARIELRKREPSRALETLSVVVPFDFADPPTLPVNTLYPAYVRGQAYLATGDGKRAAAEFGKLTAHPGMVLNFPLGALARLGLARAYAQSGDSASSRLSYQKFFEMWKEADARLPILEQARTDYAKLPQPPA